MYFSATLLCSVYILSFYTINALKTQKNGRLLYVLLQYIVTCRLVRFREAEKAYIMHIICIHTKTPTHFSHCPFSDAALSIHLTTRKTPITFRHGRCIVVDNINYFSSLIACVMYALFASFAALFASRLTFR